MFYFNEEQERGREQGERQGGRRERWRREVGERGRTFRVDGDVNAGESEGGSITLLYRA